MSSSSAGDTERDPLRFLQVLWRLNHAMERRSRHMLTTLGITAPQRMVVRFVGRRPGIAAGELAAELGVDRGTLSSALRRLEASGLLERRADPEDGRRVLIHLTRRGQQLDVDAPQTVESAVRAALRTLPRQHAQSTRRLLEALASQLGAIPRATGRTSARPRRPTRRP